MDDLGCQTNGENDKKSGLRTKKNWWIQFSDWISIWNTGEDFGNRRQQQQKRSQGEENSFKVLTGSP